MKTLITFCCVLSVSLAHRQFMDRIPNGHHVPIPCNTNVVWQAVGHESPTSGHHGENQFGKDFKKVGHEHWTRELCLMDSDGDGRTNGFELGDPNCVWTIGATPGPVQGHPGRISTALLSGAASPRRLAEDTQQAPSPSHITLTPGQPVAALTPIAERQAKH